MVDLITAFITAQLDREQRDAELISEGGYQAQRWIIREDANNQWPPEIIALDEIIGGDWLEPEESRVAIVYDGRNEAKHIVHYDPERVCAEIAAKRAILAAADGLAWDSAARDAILRALAAPYADHADYQRGCGASDD